MISASYIDKCIMAKDEIEYLVLQARGGLHPDRPGPDIFQGGDSFHHQGLMKKGESKTVRQVLRYTALISDDPTEEYPIEECILLPTEELLREGLKAVVWNADDRLRGMGPEVLLDEIIRGRIRRPSPK
jgi:hypothetical protein